MDNVYREKREFINKLVPAYSMLPGVTDIRYEHFSDKYTEYIKVTWEHGHYDYIDVTADSLTAMLEELHRLIILNENPTGLITNDNHIVIIDGWFESAAFNEIEKQVKETQK